MMSHQISLCFLCASVSVAMADNLKGKIADVGAQAIGGQIIYNFPEKTGGSLGDCKFNGGTLTLTKDGYAWARWSSKSTDTNDHLHFYYSVSGSNGYPLFRIPERGEFDFYMRESNRDYTYDNKASGYPFIFDPSKYGSIGKIVMANMDC